MADPNENLIISAGACSLTLLPALGGKIASLRVGRHELLQTPLNPYAPRTQDIPFSAGDASGWDECLPSVAACTVDTEAGPARIPDHGDLWRIPWRILDATPDSATLRASCFSLPLQLTRSLLLTETPSGWQVQLLYSLTNLGAYRVPWAWSAHPGFATEAGDRILLPSSIHTLQLEGSGNNRLGTHGDPVSWPEATLRDGTNSGTTVDLSLAAPPDSGTGDKLFAGPFDPDQPSSAWCSLHRPSVNLRLTLRFDPIQTPYLGLWLCYGGWPEGSGLKQTCAALEPTTAPVDSLAESLTGPGARHLEPGESCNWTMELLIERQI
jgi:galactose mutarotase-like enzyme